ncbi:MAG TPA: thiamine diphosphokinase [Acidimicrobiales bacterium]|jgi:thiamine pyrophosphokinase|nr:thiamine diphosphokinase [Acidimicrobiales bacterium]HJM28474.1 thiamine diphosphokinase [Acidimicrobiales bacterium]HJM98228.1 thiamine diphosphokinase [Acidimicrobiales bacterium]
MNGKRISEAVIFSGGPTPSTEILNFIEDNSFVIAADSGLDNALALGCLPNILIGDLDSISAEGLDWADNNVEIITFPKDKDKSDLELAMEYAVANCEAVLLIDSGLGRVDQLYGLFAVLGSDIVSTIPCRAIVSNSLITVVRNRVEIHNRTNNLVSIFAHSGEATGVTTSGFRWNLDGATLNSNSTLGLSNEIKNDSGIISVRNGTLLVIQPDVF